MDNFIKLADQMKQDWNRRVRHDYRFWMSDGYNDDATMWESGKRDLDLLLEGLEATSELVMLEIGCGVGRLLNAAATRFKKVIGLDVSNEAIQKARQLLSAQNQVELICGNGYDLQGIADNSIDLVISFAAISSIPTEIAANYLKEMQRVLKAAGQARLQLYLGEEQEVAVDDTLHLRCFKRDNFLKAVEIAGFEVQSIRELRLPFEVSYKEGGIEAVLVNLKKLPQPASVDAGRIARILLPTGEKATGKPDDLECWLSLSYARELAEKGKFDDAKRALEYATAWAETVSLDVRDALYELEQQIAKRALAEPQPIVATDAPQPGIIPVSPFRSANLEVLAQRFPAVFQKMMRFLAQQQEQSIEVKQTPEGPVVYSAGQCLDHPTKPIQGALVWVKRLLNDGRVSEAAEIVICGVGCGYHVEQLFNLATKKISIIEPDIAAFSAAIDARDLSFILKRVEQLAVGTEQLPDFLNENCELCVRPQTQVLHSEYCSSLRSSFYGARGFTSLHPAIAVLGPMQGGTLPIMRYTSSALQSLKQRCRELDVSGFAPGYHLLSDFLKDEMRAAVMQGNYVEMLSQMLIETLSEKPIDILICMAQAPASGRVLTELRKRGVITVLWFVEDYQRFTYWRQIAQYFDFIFTIQKGECLDLMVKAGAGSAHYLPTGCDPQVHCPLTLDARETERWGSPVSFVGAGYHNRQQMFAALCNLPFKIWGTEWPTCRPFDRLVQEQGRRLLPGEYVKIFNSTAININLHSSTERDGIDVGGDFINPRTFELAACGAFQLVDHRQLLAEAFIPGQELVVFDGLDDLRDKIDYYLNHPEERNEIARRGRERALREHTYSARLKQMLSIIYSNRFERLREREEVSPWFRLLKRSARFPEFHHRCQQAFERGEEPKLDGLVSDIVTGKGELTETEQKLLFLHHIRSQIIRMRKEEAGVSN